MTNTTDSSDYTHQFMKGFTIVGVTMASMYAFAPYADAVATESLQYINFAVLLIVSYGIYLAITSPLSVQLMEEARTRLHGGDTDAE